MKIDYGNIVSAIIPFILLAIVKLLLDLQLAHKIVKYLSWVPTRWLSRTDPLCISGNWSHLWASDSSNFPQTTDRKSETHLKQLDSYCYGEFTSKGKRYVIFGRILNDYIVGNWYDLHDRKGYFGAFQLRIVDSNILQGRWIGHSKETVEIRHGTWNWEKTK